MAGNYPLETALVLPRFTRLTWTMSSEEVCIEPPQGYVWNNDIGVRQESDAMLRARIQEVLNGE